MLTPLFQYAINLIPYSFSGSSISSKRRKGQNTQTKQPPSNRTISPQPSPCVASFPPCTKVYSGLLRLSGVRFTILGHWSCATSFSLLLPGLASSSRCRRGRRGRVSLVFMRVRGRYRSRGVGGWCRCCRCRHFSIRVVTD